MGEVVHHEVPSTPADIRAVHDSVFLSLPTDINGSPLWSELAAVARYRGYAPECEPVLFNLCQQAAGAAAEQRRKEADK